MGLIFISSIAPDQEKSIFYSLAGQQYQRKMIKAYSFDKVFSVNFYDNNNYKKIVEGNLEYLVYPKNKFLRLYYLIKFAFLVSSKTVKTDKYLFYNINNRNFFTYVYLKYVMNRKCYVLLADYDPISQNKLAILSHWLLKNADGIISLTHNIVLNRNTFFQELLIDSDEAIIKSVEAEPSHILFSGSLGKTTGVNIAIDAMRYLPNCVLHISGIVIEQDEMDALLANAGDNVIYHGTLKRGEYQSLINKCSICLSLRNPSDTNHNYNFPSKIGEYLFNNKIVITTIVYRNFENHLVFTNWDAVDLASTIKGCLNKKVGVENQDWLIKNFGLLKLRHNIDRLISNV